MLCLQVTATDNDIGLFGELLYSIIDGNVDNRFDINNKTGEIRNTKVLDREQRDSYRLIVQAKDRGPEEW